MSTFIEILAGSPTHPMVVAGMLGLPQSLSPVHLNVVLSRKYALVVHVELCSPIYVLDSFYPLPSKSV
jgi:hypothetical protein